MENKSFERVEYDYFTNSPSYVRMILEMLPECVMPTSEKVYIKNMYNSYLNSYDESEIKEIATVSLMFREKINNISLAQLITFAQRAYELYFEEMLVPGANRGIIFDKLNDSMKLFVDYSTYTNDEPRVGSR